jgi:hypothetical protein
VITEIKVVKAIPWSYGQELCVLEAMKKKIPFAPDTRYDHKYSRYRQRAGTARQTADGPRRKGSLTMNLNALWSNFSNEFLILHGGNLIMIRSV